MLNKIKQFFKKKKISIIIWAVIFPFCYILSTLLIAFLLSITNLSFNNLVTNWFSKSNLTFGVGFLLVIILSGVYWYFFVFEKKKHSFVKETSLTDYGGAEWVIDEENNKANKTQIVDFLTKYPSSFKINEPGWVIRSKYDKLKEITEFNIRCKTQTLCLGPTGSGKSQKVVIPTAIYNSRLEYDKKPCMVFTDPKGELYNLLSKSLQDEGYEILTLNLRETKYSSGWNPLFMCYQYNLQSINFRKNNTDLLLETDFNKLLQKLEYLECYTHDQIKCDDCLTEIRNNNTALFESYVINNDYYVKDINKKLERLIEITDILRNQTHTLNDSVFELDELTDEKNDILSGIKSARFLANKQLFNEIVQNSINELKGKAYEELEDLASTLFPPSGGSENSMWRSNAADMVAAVIYAMLEIMELDITLIPIEKFNLTTVAVLLTDEKNICEWFQSLPRTSKAYTTGSATFNAPDATRGGFFANLKEPLKIFQDYGIQGITCRNTINLFEFTKKPTAIFLIIPDDKTNRHILGSLFISQLYKASVEVANKSDEQTLPRQMLFLLDEFGNMPKISNMSSIITVARGRGIFFLLILQGFYQLYEKYGQNDGKTIKDNCNLFLYIQSNSDEDAESISKMIGDKTVITSSLSLSDSGQGGTNKTSSGEQLSYMPLIKGADLRRLTDPYGIAMYSKENPAKIYMEYAYKCKDLKFGCERQKKDIYMIDFYKDHYLDITELEYDNLILQSLASGEEIDLSLLDNEENQQEDENEVFVKLKPREELNEDVSSVENSLTDNYKNSTVESLTRELNILKAQILILKKNNNRTQNDKKELNQLRNKMTLVTKNMLDLTKRLNKIK